MFTGAIATYL